MPPLPGLLLGLTLIVAGVALLLVGVLGAAGRLRRNRYAGLRTPAAMRSERSFLAGNRVAGPLNAAAGAVAVAGGVALLFAGTPAVLVTLGALAGIGAIGLVAAAGLLGERAAAAVPACSTACAGCELLDCAT